jgi:rare lipoprotein A (peptidoglycan hydrolase)
VPGRIHPPTSRRTGHRNGLIITLLGAFVLAGAGVPGLAVAAAANPAASPAPIASPASSVLPAPGAAAMQVAGASPSPNPSVSASSDLALVAATPPVASPAPPPGAVAAVALQGQPYELPAFVGLGTLQASLASFYGPGFYGISNSVKACVPQAGSAAWPKLTACGVLYTRTVVGVAHRSLPCGTLVAFSYGGRTVIASVIDRGPYVAGRTWDLSGALCRALRHCFTGPIRWTIVHRAVGPSDAPVRIDLRRI